MADLDTLRTEVQKALDDLSYFLTGTHNHDDFYTIRTELVRLARENAELRRAWDDALLTGTGILKVERVDPATVRLPVAPRQGKGTPVPQSEHEALTERAEKAEAELAESRETIKRLNRRVQVAEAGVAEKVKASGGSLGRALANAAASKAEAELAALKARIAGAPAVVVQGAPGAIKASFHGYGCFEYAAENLQSKLRGKHVRLVVED